MSGEPTPASSQPNPAALQAPWRLEYLEAMGTAEKPGGAGGGGGGSGSFLLDAWTHPEQDDRNHVVVRASRGIILLNAFPYTSGHLLVALGEARPALLDYTADERVALWRLVDLAMALMLDTLQPQGVNVGVNQGRAAGAGVPQHLHVHLVPRWGGDVNFISVVGQVRVIPASLEKMAARYRAAWSAMGRAAGWKTRSGVEV
jgi:ATP adenylyltransferase